MKTIVPLMAALALLAGAPVAAGPPETVPGTDQGTRETESVADMFLRCCWARGRAAFNFCHAYAACAGVGEEVCEGVGTAKGLSVRCDNPPARLGELEGG